MKPVGQAYAVLGGVPPPASVVGEGEADMAKLSGEEVELSFHWILQ